MPYTFSGHANRYRSLLSAGTHSRVLHAICTATDETYRHRRSPASPLSKAIDGQIDAVHDSMYSALLKPALNSLGGFEWASSTIRHLALYQFESTWSTKFGLRHRLAGPLIVAQEVSSANPQFRHLNVRHFLATFGGFCPTFLPTFWPFGPQICPKSAFDVQKIDFRPHFFVIFASGSVYGLEMALPRRGLELAVTLIFVDA